MSDAPSAAFSFYEPAKAPEEDVDKAAASKGPKRKRLAKACCACHRAKRRCDGMAPCSNCFFASKSCNYTDASGRPVAAPNPGKPDASRAPRGSTARSKTYSEDDQSRTSDPSELLAERRQVRKRVKNDPPSVLQTQETFLEPSPVRDDSRISPLLLDHTLTRELTNLFFTHSHPIRSVIHKPSFSASLSHNRVPSYLLLAMCAFAAPLSRHPRMRSTAPPQLSGRPFAHEAVSQMFDGSGHLICDPNLFTAQTLCLLMVYDLIAKDVGLTANSRYRELVLQIIQVLGVHAPEPPASTPNPDAEFIQNSIEAECVRRIFWMVHISDLRSGLYHRKFISLSDAQLRLRLPVDETSFELAVHSSSPEYLHLQPDRTRWVSEFGHFIRIFSLFARADEALNRSDTNLTTVSELEKRGEDWVATLPSNLQFSEENLQMQLAMFETSSNTGAWCFCVIHIYYAGMTLALHAARTAMSPYSAPSSQRPQWAITRLDMIIRTLGDRAKKSMLMGNFIWIQIKYLNRDDAQIQAWCKEYEEVWGTRIPDLVAAIRTAERGPSYPFPIPQSSKRFDPAASSSQVHPLARSLDDSRSHTQSISWPNVRPPHTQSIPGPGFIVRSGEDRDSSFERVKKEGESDSPSKNGRLGESLPSLKSSGLLDSWGSKAHLRPDMREPLTKNSSRLESDAKPTTLSGMPVGLQWLVNES
ncbi:fungal-specific transcription factor domain-containing protein [Favolaschia claudopus]|uniref:Fungal-specific transcription factor domain-containing protein n=1 Tax=Favolaschia claudopus TaxID=2862362 RepID=A0AAW0BXI9_9AGAR